MAALSSVVQLVALAGSLNMVHARCTNCRCCASPRTPSYFFHFITRNTTMMTINAMSSPMHLIARVLFLLYSSACDTHDHARDRRLARRWRGACGSHGCCLPW